MTVMLMMLELRLCRMAKPMPMPSAWLRRRAVPCATSWGKNGGIVERARRQNYVRGHASEYIDTGAGQHRDEIRSQTKTRQVRVGAILEMETGLVDGKELFRCTSWSCVLSLTTWEVRFSTQTPCSGLCSSMWPCQIRYMSHWDSSDLAKETGREKAGGLEVMEQQARCRKGQKTNWWRRAGRC